MVYPQSKIARQYYMKIMLLVSHKLEDDILKVIEPITFHQSSFYTHKLQKSGDIDVKHIRSSDNLSDLFAKMLPTATFKKINNTGMR